MAKMFTSAARQTGMSLVGFIFVLSIVAVLVVLGMRLVPTVNEYSAIKKAIANAKQNGTTPQEIRSSFDKHAEAGYINSVTGKDLDVVQTSDGFEVSVTYQKKIPLVGPASLSLDYEATTAKSGVVPEVLPK